MTDGLNLSGLGVNGPVSNRDSILRDAVLLYQKQRYSEAINKLVAGVETDITGMYAVFVGNCYQKLGSVSDAVSFWKKAISQNPSCYQAYIGLGNLSYLREDIKQALVYWHIALTIRPEDAQVNYNLAIAYSKQDDRLMAVHYYEKFLKYSSKSDSREFRHVTKIISSLRKKAGELLTLANEAVKRNNISVAVQLYLKSLSNYPQQPKVAQNLAKIFECDRNFDKTIEYNKLVLRLDASQKMSLADIANVYMSMQEYELAYCYFAKFLQAYSSQSSMFVQVERLMEYSKSKFSGEYDAKVHLERAIEFENKLNFYHALDEYENYKILASYETESVDESIKKLSTILYPEKFLIETLITKVNELIAQSEFEEALKLCERLTILTVYRSQEFQWANSKKQELRYMLFRKTEGDK